MKSRFFSFAALFIAASVLLSSSSCARSQQLESITLTPADSTITLSGVGQVVGTQFTALGSYIHPPETRDITSQAVWATNSPSIITLDPNQPGLVNTTGTGCGTNLGVSASVYSDSSNHSAGSVVVGTATISVSFSGSTCP